MRIKLYILFISLAVASLGCDALQQVANEVVGAANTTPTSLEMSGGLKEALDKGIGFAVNTLSKENGYYGDPLVKIPFPQEAEFAAKTLRDIGLGKLVDDFEVLLNKGAEDGAKQALGIFGNAIKAMTFADVRGILLGGESAATNYFKDKTTEQLYETFSPQIKASLDKVNATKVWTDITTRYNAIPLTKKKIDTDIVRYATNKAMAGLFIKVAEEESKIRTNVSSRSSELLKKVFGFADQEKNKTGG